MEGNGSALGDKGPVRPGLMLVMDQNGNLEILDEVAQTKEWEDGPKEPERPAIGRPGGRSRRRRAAAAPGQPRLRGDSTETISWARRGRAGVDEHSAAELPFL